MREGKWYLSIQYEVDVIKKQVTKEPIGIDRNVRQCYDSNGIKYPLRDLESLANGSWSKLYIKDLLIVICISEKLYVLKSDTDIVFDTHSIFFL